jgi:hypothetical protein
LANWVDQQLDIVADRLACGTHQGDIVGDRHPANLHLDPVRSR